MAGFKLKVSDKIGEVSCELNEAKEPEYMITMAHGAGAGMHHSFMQELALSIAGFNATVLRFNFPYKEQGKKLPGSPGPAIETIHKVSTWCRVNFSGLPLILSGKSYGGRMSSHLIADGKSAFVRGLIYFGFPLHSPGIPESKRAQHLYQITIPQLFLQGTRDSLASLDLIQETVNSIPQATMIQLDNADHSFKVPGKPGSEVIKSLAEAANDWINKMVLIKNL